MISLFVGIKKVDESCIIFVYRLCHPTTCFLVDAWTVRLDNIAMNTLISSCETFGCWDVALDLLKKMRLLEATAANHCRVDGIGYFLEKLRLVS